MKKNLLVLGIFMGLAFLVVGCTNATENKTNEQETAQVIYEKLTTIPSDLKTAVKDVEKKKGFGLVKANGDEKYVFIGLGERPTDGYDVDVKSVVEVDNTVTIEVDEIKPAKDAKVTTGKTYPYAIVKVNTAMDTFEVINTSGEKFDDVFDQTSTTDETTTTTTEKTTTTDTTGTTDTTNTTTGTNNTTNTTNTGTQR